jgi:hypothetical protein
MDREMESDWPLFYILKIAFIDFNWFLLKFVDVLCIVFQSMLRLDPSRRITARGALEHEYFKDIKCVP